MITIPQGVITNPQHEMDITFTVKRVKNKIITHSLQFQCKIEPEDIAIKSFVLNKEEDLNKLYSSTEHKFNLTFKTVNHMPDDWAIKLTLTSL